MDASWILSKLASRPQAIEDGVCNFCGEQILSFKDELSKREYQISALCQNCQDDMFDEDPFVEDDTNE